MVRPKKHLGQHFLKEASIAKDIAQALLLREGVMEHVLEIGPGTGALTQFLLERQMDLKVMEVDTESVRFLHSHFPLLKGRIFEADFLNYDLTGLFNGETFYVTGNFPYNISSQILFRLYEDPDRIPQLVGMFQKEVAMRIASPHGNKDYGILSVLLQAFYDISYLFTVDEQAFLPPPKVKSGVIRMTRNNRKELPCNKDHFTRVVKAAFNQRRKMLRNSLAGLIPHIAEHPLATKRPEQVSVDEFISLSCDQ